MLEAYIEYMTKYMFVNKEEIFDSGEICDFLYEHNLLNEYEGGDQEHCIVNALKKLTKTQWNELLDYFTTLFQEEDNQYWIGV